MPVDAFVEATILDADGVVRKGWIPHFTTCTDPDRHRVSRRGDGSIPTGTRQPKAVAALSMLAEAEAYGGRPAEVSFEVTDTAVVLTFPRSPGSSPRGPMPQPRQRDLGLDGEPRANGPTDLGGYVEDSRWQNAASRYSPSDGGDSDPDL